MPVSAGVAYAATYAMGKAAIAYFIGDADEEEAREILIQKHDEAEETYDDADVPPVAFQQG